MVGRFNYAGLVIAVVGFVLTRFTVSLALYEDPVRFYVAGVIPLVLGLGLAGFGVALVVADLDPEYVRITALWCVVGMGTMAVFVAMTIVGSRGGVPGFGTLREQLFLSNFLIGGSIGGTLTGLYAARTRRQRLQLEQQANRLEALNRILRHEVLNAITVIKGHADLDGNTHPGSSGIIREYADVISQTIDTVRYLAAGAGSGVSPTSRVDLVAHLQASIETVQSEHPGVDIDAALPDELAVVANSRLELVFTHLLENAVIHTGSDAASIEVSVATTPTSVAVSIADSGPGLPSAQQRLLAAGELTEFDDPRDGYGLNIVRLLVESFDGALTTDVSEAGTTVSVSLRRPEASGSGLEPTESGLVGLRLDRVRLLVVLVASVVAAVSYGAVSAHFGGSVAGIGVFYGLPNPVVGWITHIFHSVVFGLMYAGLLTRLPPRYHTSLTVYTGLAILWGLALWIGAASIIAPLWLNLLGITVPLPNPTVRFLFTHLAWGVTLGPLTALGYRYLRSTAPSATTHT